MRVPSVTATGDDKATSGAGTGTRLCGAHRTTPAHFVLMLLPAPKETCGLCSVLPPFSWQETRSHKGGICLSCVEAKKGAGESRHLFHKALSNLCIGSEGSWLHQELQ